MLGLGIPCVWILEYTSWTRPHLASVRRCYCTYDSVWNAVLCI